MLTIDGQLSIFDFIDAPAERYGWCPCCHTAWIIMVRTEEWKIRTDQEHAVQSDGRCLRMHEMGITEPFYTVAEIETQVFADGGRIQYPRPKGFGGLYQTRKA